MGKLTAVYGPMFAGKTTWLLKRIEEYRATGRECLVVKPKLDNRYGDEAELRAHSGIRGEARLVNEQDPEEILRLWEGEGEKQEIVIIDEAMFFNPKLEMVVKELLGRDLEVVAAGLDLDYRKRGFGVMPRLIKMSQEKIALAAKCYKCGERALYSARLAGGAGKIVVGASESYQPACKVCHTVYEEQLLHEIEMPLFRRGDPRIKEVRVEVMSDSMRVGKTTAVAVIAEGLRRHGYVVTESYEDWQHNPYLKGSYSDPARNFLESQKWFAKRKWEQVKEGGKGIFVQDVTPEMDYCYAVTNLLLGRMSQKNFGQYYDFYKKLAWGDAPVPTILVYLKVGDKELMRRAMNSRREFETVEEDYFLMMKKVNREWLVKARKNKAYNILEVETDKLDFAHGEGAKEELVSLVMKELDLL